MFLTWLSLLSLFHLSLAAYDHCNQVQVGEIGYNYVIFTGDFGNASATEFWTTGNMTELDVHLGETRALPAAQGPNSKLGLKDSKEFLVPLKDGFEIKQPNETWFVVCADAKDLVCRQCVVVRLCNCSCSSADFTISFAYMGPNIEKGTRSYRVGEVASSGYYAPLDQMASLSWEYCQGKNCSIELKKERRRIGEPILHILYDKPWLTYPSQWKNEKMITESNKGFTTIKFVLFLLTEPLETQYPELFNFNERQEVAVVWDGLRTDLHREDFSVDLKVPAGLTDLGQIEQRCVTVLSTDFNGNQMNKASWLITSLITMLAMKL